jgi:hypothetical protein
MANETYLRDCYDDYYMIQNCGGLTLVHPDYFDFGRKLIQVIVDSFGVSEIKEYGSDAVTRGWMLMNDKMKELKPMFLELGAASTTLSKTKQEEILDILVRKTRNARNGMDIRKYQAESTARGGKMHIGLAHRQTLKAIVKGKEVRPEIVQAVVGNQ